MGQKGPFNIKGKLDFEFKAKLLGSYFIREMFKMLGENDELNINDYINILKWLKVAYQDWEIKVAGIYTDTKRKIKELALREIPNADEEEVRELQKLLNELFLI